MQLRKCIVQVGPMSLLLITCTKPHAQTTQTTADSVTRQTDSIVTPLWRPKLLPRDEADSSFRAFREQLLAALARRDTAFLYNILAPEIKNSFGGDDSISGFRRLWSLDKPQTSTVWNTLTRILQLGGKMQDDSTFVAPYVYAFWPDSIDAFENYAHTKPPYEIVKSTEAKDSASYYSPVGYRAFFAKRSARWTMVTLVAGD